MLSLPQVRALASEYGYKEKSYNQQSRVVILTKHSTQVNVYYTTGTIGTCLNHPKQGKTQMFRRNADIHLFKDILANPMIHTGRGYQYRKNGWVAIDSGSAAADVNDSASSECDLVRRWKFVAAATGFCDESEVEDIAAFCQLWEVTETLPGTNTRKPGAGCCLFDLLVLTGQACEHYELFQREGAGDSTLISDDVNCLCDDGIQFKRVNANNINRLRSFLLSSFGAETRRELLIWFLGRDGPKFVSHDGETAVSRDDVSSAHEKYSDLYYKKKSGLCRCHGLSRRKV